LNSEVFNFWPGYKACLTFVLYCFSWYTKAQQIAPKNGRPYNQLAILALYTVSDKHCMYVYTELPTKPYRSQD